MTVLCCLHKIMETIEIWGPGYKSHDNALAEIIKTLKELDLKELSRLQNLK